MKPSLAFQLMFSVYKCLRDGRQREKQETKKKKLLLPLVNEVIKKLQCWALSRLSDMQIYFLRTSLTQLVFVFGCLL